MGLIAVLVLGVVRWRAVIPTGWLVMAVVGLVVSVSSTNIDSLGRYALAYFPAWTATLALELAPRRVVFWLVLAVNSITFGGLLFLLSAGFSLIFGLMRIPNLTHGSLFMLGGSGSTDLSCYEGAGGVATIAVNYSVKRGSSPALSSVAESLSAPTSFQELGASFSGSVSAIFNKAA